MGTVNIMKSGKVNIIKCIKMRKEMQCKAYYIINVLILYSYNLRIKINGYHDTYIFPKIFFSLEKHLIGENKTECSDLTCIHCCVFIVLKETYFGQLYSHKMTFHF